MKKNIIFIILLFLLGCTTEKQELNLGLCPEVLFSKDHRIYIATEKNLLTYNNISFTAELNNYNFSNCQISNNILDASLSLLFVVKPDKAELARIIMPYFIAILNDQQTIIDIQYYNVYGNLNQNASSYVETEIIDTQQINIFYKDKNSDLNNKILIGFMLDKEKLKILN